MTLSNQLAEGIKELSLDQKRKLLAQLLKDMFRENGMHEVPVHDDDGNLRGYFVPAARRYLLKENTELIEELKRRAENPGKSIPWQEFKKTLEALGS